MPGSFDDISRYPDLDLTPVFDVPAGVDPVVFCDSQEEAWHFIAVMNRSHPDYCNSWQFPETRFTHYQDDGVGYRLMHSVRRIQFCSQSYYRDRLDAREGREYKIVQLSDLLVQSDIAESEMSLDALMGV